jgi:hypothetical protein
MVEGESFRAEVLPMRALRKLSAVALVLGVCLVSTLNAARAGDSTESLDRARALIEEQRTVIAFCMHPTAKLKSVTRAGTKSFESGDFRVEYTFHFTSTFGNDFRSKMQFYFFGNGALDYCVGRETTGLVRPFTTANLVVDWIKGKIREDASVQNNRELLRLIDNGNAKTLLEWWLKAKS